MKEGAHIAGYSLQRSMENLRWLLEDSRFEQLAGGYKNVNDFLRDTQDAFKLLNIRPEERKQIAELVKELQPKASQRAIGELMGVSGKTIDRDLGYIDTATNVANIPVNTVDIATNVAPPAIPPDDYDPIKDQQRKIIQETSRREAIAKLESIQTKEAKKLSGIYDVIVIDPPWEMEKIERKVAPKQVEFEYPTMTLDEIKKIEIPAADNCHVWLWTTQKHLPSSFNLLEYWKLKYVCMFVWHKNGGFQPFGLPQYNCEFVLYARKGSPFFIDQKMFFTCFEAPRGKHSEKPEEFYSIIRRVTAGRRLDMFNRRSIEGFDGWGKESCN